MSIRFPKRIHIDRPAASFCSWTACARSFLCSLVMVLRRDSKYKDQTLCDGACVLLHKSFPHLKTWNTFYIEYKNASFLKCVAQPLKIWFLFFFFFFIFQRRRWYEMILKLFFCPHFSAACNVCMGRWWRRWIRDATITFRSNTFDIMRPIWYSTRNNNVCNEVFDKKAQLDSDN